MRKIEQQMIDAIKSRKNWSNSNTYTEYSEKSNRVAVYLHHNHIANVWYEGDVPQVVYLSDAGWMTVTTKSRLNAICGEFLAQGMGIYQKNWEWFFTTEKGDIEWEGSITINNYDEAEGEAA